MPFKLKHLFLFFLLFDFLWGLYMGMNNVGFLQYFKDNYGSLKSIKLVITTTLSFFLYALSAYFFLWYFSKRKKQLLAFLCIICCIPLVILFRYFLEEIFSPAVFGFRNYRPDILLTDYIKDNKYYSIPHTAFGIIFYFFQSNSYKEGEKKELQVQTRQAELDYLKAQINPHFLLNNLNSIYSLVYHKSEKSLFAVEQLSSLLQYMLYEKKEKVLLSYEIRYLMSFIDLQKLRYDYDLPISLSNTVTDSNLKIAPLLLIPLVENAFKHGDFRDPQFPLVIQLATADNKLLAVVENKKGQLEKDSTSGIGIANLKRRLELMYPGNYQLEINEDDACYRTTLKINL